MKPLYPAIAPFHHFYLKIDNLHSLYVEQSGNPQGIPVIFLHGGPCSGTKPHHRCFFNPKHYHIILMDQRGSGQSLPFGEIEKNTTQHLIDDMEAIRKKLAIEKWLLFSGSWGSTLALLYAQQHSQHVLGMILRGVFLARQKDLDWYTKDGAGRIFPEKWEQLSHCTPHLTENNFLNDLHKGIFGTDKTIQQQIAKAWSEWGGQVALMQQYREDKENTERSEKMIQQAQMEIHYAHNNYFINENQVLDNCNRLQAIPSIIIHGRNDLVCPLEAGLSLHRALPKAEYIVLANAGHIANSEEMINALVDATDKMPHLISL